MSSLSSTELEKLLKSSQLIQQQLNTIKRDIQNSPNVNAQKDSSAILYLRRAIQLRTAFRDLAQGIQQRRMLAQIQKEKIQKSKDFLEGLQYYKATLLSKIQENQTDVIKIDEYIEKPLSISNWIEQYQNAQKVLIDQLELRRTRQSQYAQLTQTKTKRQTYFKEKKDLYEKKLPIQAKKILDQVMETCKILDIKQFEEIKDIESKDLSTVYGKLHALRVNGDIEITYSKDVYQQLEITILKNNCNFYRLAQLNKINIVEKDIKITISCLKPLYSELVLGLDRRSDFTNEDVFQRLVNNQTVKVIFKNPQNENERNINTKYVRLQSIKNLLLNGIVSPETFIEKIRERVFSLLIAQYIKESIKKVQLFFQIPSDKGYQLPVNFKKNVQGTFQKIRFEEYQKLVHIPKWIKTYMFTFEQNQKSNGFLSANTSTSLINDRNNFKKILNNLNLGQIIEPCLNNYFKGTFSFNTAKIQYILIVPYQYPAEPSRIIVKDFQKKKNEKNIRIQLNNIQNRINFNSETKSCSQNVLYFEDEVNEKTFTHITPENKIFTYLIQINRLLTLFGQSCDRKI